jgi:hypothetical protein
VKSEEREGIGGEAQPAALGSGHCRGCCSHLVAFEVMGAAIAARAAGVAIGW